MFSMICGTKQDPLILTAFDPNRQLLTLFVRLWNVCMSMDFLEF